MVCEKRGRERREIFNNSPDYTRASHVPYFQIHFKIKMIIYTTPDSHMQGTWSNIVIPVQITLPICPDTWKRYCSSYSS